MTSGLPGAAPDAEEYLARSVETLSSPYVGLPGR